MKLSKLIRIFRLTALLICVLSGQISAQELPKGSLVIVGGGLEPDNQSVFTQLIALSGGVEKAIVSVIPSASGVAAQTYAYFSKELISYGVKPENIHLIPIAMVDDDSTTLVNEATWSKNAYDPALAKLVRQSTCVWFSGGDQLRTMKTLVKPDGSNTPVLDAVWEVFKQGGVIGGTSAGAAIMSNPMIGAGNSMAALLHGVKTDFRGDDFPEDSGVYLTRGLGFFPLGMVDQHFNARARLGRFVVALMHEKPTVTLGFGIDENTALIYNGLLGKLQVAGVGGVTVINTGNARIKMIRNLPEIRGVVVGFLQEGDCYEINTGRVIPAGNKKKINGNEYYNVSNATQAGIFSVSGTSFPELISISLMDNKAVNQVTNLNFTGANTAFRVTLNKTPESAAFSTCNPDSADKYTITGVTLHIEPVTIEVKPLEQ